MLEECPATFQACQNSVVGADILPYSVVDAHKTPIPDGHGKTPCMPLGINNMAGTDVCYIRRRRHNLSHASDINSVMGAYNHLVPNGVGNKT